jgi:hypothetical protein
MSPLKVDNIADTITEFEKLKAYKNPKTPNNELINKIYAMTDEQFQVYRKMQ